MSQQMVVLWVVELLQMIALSIFVSRLRTGMRPAQRPRARVRELRAGDTWAVEKLHPIAAASAGVVPALYLVVGTTCPSCERLLQSLLQDGGGPARIAATMIGIGNVDQVAGALSVTAETLGMGLAACDTGSELGITQIPWMVAVAPDRRVLWTDSGARPSVVRRYLSGTTTLSGMAEPEPGSPAEATASIRR
jgi:hypothetical protein